MRRCADHDIGGQTLRKSQPSGFGEKASHAGDARFPDGIDSFRANINESGGQSFAFR
jgi:hypothetical protein